MPAQLAVHRLFSDHLCADMEIPGSGSCALTPFETNRVIVRDDPCRSDLLLLAEWAHALTNYQGALQTR
jgi:hypothetical protein